MLQGKTVVVTGAGRGIGQVLARGFAEQGARVMVHYAHSEQGAEAVAEEIRGQGGQAWLVQADLRRPEDVTRLVAQAEAELGKIDVWINNAGASANASETPGMSKREIFGRLLEVDVLGTWLCCQEAVNVMQDGGCILNTGWSGALLGVPGFAGQMYAMSKGAIIALTRSLAVEYAPRIRVNCIAPGYIENEWSSSLSTARRQRMIQHVPLQRWGTAQDILGTALFLASPAASYMTGQILVVDGGELRY